MAYNLTAQLNLQAPSQASIKKIRAKIERGLRGMVLDIDTKSVAKAKKEIDNLVSKNTKIKVEADTKNIKKARNEVTKTGKELTKANKEAQAFSENIALRGRNFAAYAIASTAIIKLSSALSSATREAIKFEQELAKIAQVQNVSTKSILAQSDSLRRLSIDYNLSLNKITQVTRILSQTGLSFREAAKAAEAISKTSLLATFESVESTTEGLIAIMNTFSLSVRDGERALEKINAVSKQFAVESSDIVEAVRRTGGAYSAAGGKIEELIAQFTAVRSTSRESAETIATGFRTIFGRLQRPKTIEYFRELGIELETAAGKFVGPEQAISAISEGLERLGISAGDVRFAQVVEQVGGIRQLSKVVPLLQEAAKARQALTIQEQAAGETERDLSKAQQTLAFRFGQLQKNFESLVSEIVQTSSFQALASIFIDMGNAIVSIVRAIKPLVPLLATFAAFKIGKGVLEFIRGGFQTGSAAGSGSGSASIIRRAAGGFVPGSGNGDTVPALLTPGEFVINKKSAQSVGYSQLSRINKYAKGGLVQRFASGGKAQPSDAVTSIEDAFSILIKVVDTMGEEGKKLLRSLTIAEVNDSNYRGKFSPKSNTIGINPQFANQKTVAEEGFHALDFSRGQGKKFASQQEGTFENQLAEIARKTIKYRAQKLVEEGKITEEYLDYLDDPREAYAKLAANSNDTIRSIIASQGSIEQKMKDLAKALEDPANDPSGLFSGIGVNIARRDNPQPDPVLSPKNTTTIDQIQKEIAQKSKAIKALESVTSTYENLESKLKKLDDQIAQGIPNSKAQQKAAEIRISIARQLAEKEGEYLQTLDNLNQVVEEREKLISRAKTAKDRKRAKQEGTGLAAGNQTNFKDFIQSIEKETKKEITLIQQLNGVLSVGKNVLASWFDSFDSTKLAIFNTGLQGAGIALKNLGYQFKQEEFTQGFVRGQVIGEAGSGIQKGLSTRNVIGAGKSIENFGRTISSTTPKIGGFLSKFGKNVTSTALTVGKFTKVLGSGLNVIGGIEAIGGFVDALFSTDYTSELKGFIAAGDSANAAAIAQKQYAQELNRTIPIIGGFLNALGVTSTTSIFGNKDQEDAAVKTAELRATSQKSVLQLEQDRANIDKATALDPNTGRAQTGPAFTKALGTLGNLEQSLNNQKDAALKASEGINSLTGDILAGAGAGFLTGSSAAVVNPGAGLAGGLALGAAGAGQAYFQNRGNTARANATTDAFVEELSNFGVELDKVTQQAEGVAQRSAKRVFAFGGDLAGAFDVITKDLGGSENVNDLFGFDPSTIKNAKDYEKAVKDAQERQKAATAAIGLNNAIVEEGVSLTKGQTLADVNKAKIAAQQAELDKQRAEAALKLLNNTQTVQIQDQALNAERARSIAINKRLIAFRQAENRILDQTIKFQRKNTLGEEKINQARTGVVGEQTRRDQFGVGEIQRDLESTLRSNTGTQQFLQVANSLGLGQQASQANNIDKALRNLQETKDTQFFADTIGVEKALKAANIDDKTAEKIASEISQVNGDIKAIDRIRQSNVEETAGRSFEAVSGRLDAIFAAEQDLQNKRLQYEKNIFELRTKHQDIVNNQQIDAINTFSQFETARKGIRQGAESRLSAIRQTRIQTGETDLTRAKLFGGPEQEEAARQRLIQAHQDELDSIKNKINADAEYQKTVLQARSDLIKDYGFGSDSERRGLRFSAGFATVAGQQNSLEGIPKEQRQNVRSFFERFGDVQLQQFGNRTGNEVAADISTNELIKDIRLAGGNVTPEQAQQLKETARQKLKPPEEALRDAFREQQKAILDLNKEQYEKEKSILDIEKQVFTDLATRLNDLFTQAGLISQTTPNGAGGQFANIPESNTAPNLAVDIQGQQEVVVRLVSNGDVNAVAEKVAYDAISKKFTEMADKIQVTAPELAQSFREGNV